MDQSIIAYYTKHCYNMSADNPTIHKKYPTFISMAKLQGLFFLQIDIRLVINNHLIPRSLLSKKEPN